MYPNLYAEMARTGLKKEVMAKELGISLSCLYQRLNKGKLLGSDMFKIKEVFFPQRSFEYLFATSKIEEDNVSLCVES